MKDIKFFKIWDSVLKKSISFLKIAKKDFTVYKTEDVRLGFSFLFIYSTNILVI